MGNLGRGGALASLPAVVGPQGRWKSRPKHAWAAPLRNVADVASLRHGARLPRVRRSSRTLTSNVILLDGGIAELEYFRRERGQPIRGGLHPNGPEDDDPVNADPG